MKYTREQSFGLIYRILTIDIVILLNLEFTIVESYNGPRRRLLENNLY